MFSRKEYLFFIASTLLVILAFACMTYDPSENGFGILTRSIAPVILLIGLLLPVPAIIGFHSSTPSQWLSSLQSHLRENLAGLFVFAAALGTYLLTLEPTASLWDCSEFIATAYKLQVPHTPGTPLLLVIGRIFTLFSFGDVTRVAITINAMSACFSALTVMLVYYIILMLGNTAPHTACNHPGLILSAMGGSLCLAFSDTFWFSAVEAETYGASCFFMVLLMWMILKGKDFAEPRRSRWRMLIFYIAGLSYCIHPMSLLALPVLPFAWYTRHRNLSFWRLLMPAVAGALIVLFINRFIAVGIPELAFYTDLFVVNQLGMPFYTGAMLMLTGFIVAFILLIRRYKTYQAYTWCAVFLIAGFLPYGIIIIRSGFNPPIDEGNPENLSLFKAYMNRESYPTRPLLYGPYFDAAIEDVTAGKRIYHQGKSSYELAGTLSEYTYTPERQTVLPRMYSNDPAHIAGYQQWTGLKPGEKPGFKDNIVFTLQYQVGHMYLRYVLWNFAGRAGDVQDSSWLAPWDAGMSSHAQRARNQYWAIPLLLGMIGSIFHFRYNRKDFVSISIFFLLTGLILVLYLNATPHEPRERDYIFVGSYIAFCIWIGMGIYAVYNLLRRGMAARIITGCICILVPAWMFYQNYDDHNRSGRTFQIDQARNTLRSCAANAILFTGGDNDTFPFWYLQEVEGYRADVRVVVLSYFNTDWYIHQLEKQYYQSKPFQLSLSEKAYRQYGPNDVLYLQESIREGIDTEKYLALLKAEHPALHMKARSGETYSILPSRLLKIRLDKKQFEASAQGNLLPGDSISEELTFRVIQNYLTKNTLAFLDLLISNHWQRPLYFNFTSLNTFDIDIKPYMVQEGTLYRLLPTLPHKDGMMNTALMYKNLVEQSDYTNLSDSAVYFNYEDYHLRMIYPLQQTFNALAHAFYEQGNAAMAEQVLATAVDKVYPDNLIPSYPTLQASQMLLALGRNELAEDLSKNMFDYYYAQTQHGIAASNETNVYLLRMSARILDQLGKSDYLSRIEGLAKQTP